MTVVWSWCPVGWQDTHLDLCMQFVPRILAKNWGDAEVYCQNRGGELASIRNDRHKVSRE